ncbi:NUDIX domain-containing protein [Methylobacterium sp. 37f]|uniref:NUDIX hydrolase n=1 Tax=Methylobacterium sp. 37f TaxID=2817058 RepID=UPI001FFCE843|nr:NUDIX domain-containing protein [Methylobacterium sp. 37f]MCK2057207.1 NUDIX domain-containing protein [Methylobacterium sp. 37f]
MTSVAFRDIRIAAGLIDDGHGRLLLVRKRGTRWFMQAGGKIETGESARSALCRELHEEIGVTLEEGEGRHLGCYRAVAANETGMMVQAELFHLRLAGTPTIGSEIEEAIWVTHDAAGGLPLAPLTRDHVLPLARALPLAKALPLARAL